jgi:hypothetical protein
VEESAVRRTTIDWVSHSPAREQSRIEPKTTKPRKKLPDPPTKLAILKLGLTSDTKATGTIPVAFVFASPFAGHIYR